MTSENRVRRKGLCDLWQCRNHKINEPPDYLYIFALIPSTAYEKTFDPRLSFRSATTVGRLSQKL